MRDDIGWARPSAALAAAAAAMPPLATVAPLGILPLLLLGATAALALGGYRDLPRLRGLRPLLLLLVSIAALGLVSALWSIAPGHSVASVLRLIGVSVAGLCLCAVALGLEPPERERVRRAFLYGVLLALLLLGIAALLRRLGFPGDEGPIAEWLRGYTRFNRASTTLALAIWPALYGFLALGERLRGTLLLAAAAAVLTQLVDQTAVLAIALGLAVWPLGWRFPRLTAAAMAAVLVALVALLPLAPLGTAEVVHIHATMPAIKPSGLHRLTIWHFVSERIAERPWLGWGFDASRAIPGGSDRVNDPAMPWLSAMGAVWLPLHPHSAALQWRVELGWPGALLLTLLACWLLASASAAGTAARRATALALMGSGLVVAMLSYGFWQEWWESSLWLIAAAFLAAPRAVQAGPR